MNERHARPSKLSTDRKGKSINYENQDHFEELRRLIENSSNGVELFLEVEIDSRVRELLSSPENCDDFLDVTIIQQSDSFHEATVSLNVNEVSNFIEMVNYHDVYSKRNLVEQGSGKLASKTSSYSKQPQDELPSKIVSDHQRNHYFDCATGNEIYAPRVSKIEERVASVIFDEGEPAFPSVAGQDETQVYTTPHTFSDLRQKIPCMNPARSCDEKPGTPCLCQHCGMVGVLVESQKRPAIPHTPNPKFIPPKHSQKKRNEDYGNSRSETNLMLLRELSKKITSLELRLNEHEEKTVRKDYFKLVIHKLLTQYSNKINELKHTQEKPRIDISTQYNKLPSSKLKEESDERKRNTSWDRYQEPERDDKNRLYPIKGSTSRESHDSDSMRNVKRAYRQSRSRQKNHENNVYSKRDESTSSRARETSTREDGRSRRTKNAKKDLKSHNDVLRLPPNVDDIAGFANNRNVYTVRNFSRSPFRNTKTSNESSEKRTLIDKFERDITENVSTDTIKKLCDLVYNKCNERYKEKTREHEMAQMRETSRSRERRKPRDDSAFRRNIQARKDGGCQRKPEVVKRGDVPDKLLKNRRPTSRHREMGDKVNVSYVNPAVRGWLEQQSSEDMPTVKKHIFAKNVNKHSIEDKIKYLKELARKKNVDETELWNNILSQAKKHIKSNEDTVSIQLPGGGGGVNNVGMSELELTLSNLKEIVKKSRSVRKNKSCLSMELIYKTSSDNYLKPGSVGQRDPNRKTRKRTSLN